MQTDHTSPAAGRNRDPETIDVIDNLQRTSGQLEALLVSVTGTGGDHFRLMRPDLQDRLLDCAYDLSARVREAAARL